MKKLKIGLLINPVAGLGGSVALKGSDGENIQQQAIQLGATPQAEEKALRTLQHVVDYKNKVEFYTVSGQMGEHICQKLQFSHSIVHTTSGKTSASDTEHAINEFENIDLDIIVFAGGDGTARNVTKALNKDIPVLGIPAGCKIHSGVYSVTPSAAGKLLQKLLTGEMLSVSYADVMDIDESSFRQGIVKTKRYGELPVPMDLTYIQAVKQGGIEHDELVLADICADIIENMEDDTLYLIGSGATTKSLMDELQLDSTLLGIDAVYQENLIGKDLTALQIEELLADYPKTKLIVSPIGGQGHLFGRGNQQLSAKTLAAIGKNNTIVVSTKSKLKALQGRPLIIDVLDQNVAKSYKGLIKITTGYHDSVLYSITD
ncbi:ATP-NAD kinase family protein [Catenovulum sediminis]|uniref:ATP-NAD kinase family protein n=1 Tax=Catenovulum sediminis TaxID=1740262 RepID=UPI00117D31BE|nr:ATP-NAD kinase family protein [Catenovulum sediminis]